MGCGDIGLGLGGVGGGLDIGRQGGVWCVSGRRVVWYGGHVVWEG